MGTMLTRQLSLTMTALAALVPLLFVACGDDANLGGVDGAGASGAAGTGGSMFGGNGSGGGGLFDGCASTGAVADNTMGPATVVLFIDNSPSMRDEIVWTRDNLNTFAQSIETAGLDLQVVVIACMEDGTCEGHSNAWGICVPEPLGADGGCDGAPPHDDNNPPDYLHVDVRIPSVKGFERVIDTHDLWKDMVRPGTALHFIGISDDTEEWSAAEFNAALLALDPAYAGYFFHGIFSYQSKDAACDVSASDPCCLYAAPDGEGTHYRDLVLMTDGVQGDLCAQDFDPVFQQFATAVIESASLSCEWEIPPPPEGETLDPALVNVVFVDESSTSTVIGQVPSAADCSSVSHGWYYDNPAAPTAVIMCPQTCTWIQDRQGAEIRIEFGCETEVAVPR